MLKKQGHPQSIIDSIAMFALRSQSLHNVDTDLVIQEMRPIVKYDSGLIVTTEPNRLLSFLCAKLTSFAPFLQTVKHVV